MKKLNFKKIYGELVSNKDDYVLENGKLTHKFWDFYNGNQTVTVNQGEFLRAFSGPNKERTSYYLFSPRGSKDIYHIQKEEYDNFMIILDGMVK